jgi:hypothetical protein
MVAGTRKALSATDYPNPSYLTIRNGLGVTIHQRGEAAGFGVPLLPRTVPARLGAGALLTERKRQPPPNRGDP